MNMDEMIPLEDGMENPIYEDTTDVLGSSSHSLSVPDLMMNIQFHHTKSYEMPDLVIT